jgi:hypothetical protein
MTVQQATSQQAYAEMMFSISIVTMTLQNNPSLTLSPEDWDILLSLMQDLKDTIQSHASRLEMQE